VNIRRGEIWSADIPGDKRRPIVIITRDSVLPRLTTILIAPITTKVRGIPTEVPIAGLPRTSVANMDNIRALPTTSLVQRVGRLSANELDAICSAARFAIGC
jgi:mRNA interferase MazF